ncbi:MAG: C1 family peptidase [Elusimicrobiota bacterium]
MKTRNTLFITLLLAALPCAGGAQEVTFDSLYRGTKLIKVSPAYAIPAPSPAKSVDGGRARANPEYDYEALISAPVWRAAPGAAPVRTDLREGFSPARHQGNRNLCSVFSASALAEYLVWKKEGRKPDLSEEFLYYDAKLKFTDKPELQVYKKESGLAGYVAVDALRGGVVAEAEWPFLPRLPAHTPVPPLLDPDVGAPPAGIFGKALGYSFAPQAVRRSEIKDFLMKERRPVAVNMMFYMDNIGAGGRLSDPTEAQREKCFTTDQGNCYGHVVLFTGYDPAAGELTFRNSWGAGWGDAGYGRMSEKYLLENCEGCHYLPRLASFDQGTRTMVVNSAYGWSAALK